jgi:hypothetical protein
MIHPGFQAMLDGSPAESKSRKTPKKMQGHTPHVSGAARGPTDAESLHKRRSALPPPPEPIGGTAWNGLETPSSLGTRRA